MLTLWQDIRHDIRALLAGREFAVAAILCLALGIGMNTALFSIVNTSLLKPLPCKDPKRLVRLYERHADGYLYALSGASFAACKEGSRSFEDMSAYVFYWSKLAQPGSTQALSGMRATTNMFDFLGLTPILGRTFLPEDGDGANRRVALLTESGWRRHFAADPGVVGTTIVLDNESHAVIGVVSDSISFLVPPAHNFGDKTEVIVPLVVDSSLQQHWMQVIARIRNGVTMNAAEEECGAIMLRKWKASDVSITSGGVKGAHLVDVKSNMTKKVRPMLLFLQGAGVLVLLIACVNVVTLLFARNAAKQRATAIRVALGASRLRILRQFLTETVFLSAVSGIVGVLVAMWGIDWFVQFSPAAIPRLSEVRIDRTVLVAAVGTCLLIGAVFGFIQAMHALKTCSAQRLFAGTREPGPAWGQYWLLSIPIAFEVVLSLTLLSGFCLMANSVWRLGRVDPGFEVNDTLSAAVIVPEALRATPESVEMFVRGLLERVNAIPQVRQVAASTFMPMTDKAIAGVRPQGAKRQGYIQARIQHVAGDYFRVMDIPLTRGGNLSHPDTGGELKHAVISEALATRLFGREEPVGRGIEVRSAGQANYKIVGVSVDVRTKGLGVEAEPTIYVPYATEFTTTLMLTIRTTAPPDQVMSDVRHQIWFVDRDIVLTSVRTMRDIVSQSVVKQRFALFLLASFAVTGVLLVTLGVYGSSAYFATQRTREVAIHMAVGAQRNEMLVLLTARMLLLCMLGLAVGVVTSVFVAKRHMEGMVFGISPADPLTLAVAGVLLGGMLTLACYAPARKVILVNPMLAIKHG